jgi:hypothetical protein
MRFLAFFEFLILDLGLLIGDLMVIHLPRPIKKSGKSRWRSFESQQRIRWRTVAAGTKRQGVGFRGRASGERKMVSRYGVWRFAKPQGPRIGTFPDPQMTGQRRKSGRDIRGSCGRS